jgi:hypothetical protein
MMGHKQKLNAAETDAFTGWRHLYCYLQKAGTRAEIKRGARRRERRQAKNEIRNEPHPQRLPHSPS